MRHNNIRQFQANLLRKVCAVVETEPQLETLDGEKIIGLTDDKSKPDVRARGIWRPGQNSFFDIRVTNTNSDSQLHLSPEKVIQKHEQEKKPKYNHYFL